MNIDPTKVVHAARHGIPLVIKTHRLPPATEADLEEILSLYLQELGWLGLEDKLVYCLRELTTNAKKANTKRVYFQERGWNIEDPIDYERGMTSFKSDTLSNLDHYLEAQEKADLWIKVTFLIRDTVLHLSVRNNSPLHAVELERARTRIERGWKFKSVEEAFIDLLDDTEGAGLGLGILVLTLRQMGLDHKAFRLESVDGTTVATLVLPMEGGKFGQVVELTDKAVELIESLPPFPENLRSLLELLDDPNVPFSTLAQSLGRDPALVADLIKYLNSARNRTQHQIVGLEEAVRIVGIQALRELIYPYGAHRVLAKYVANQKELWENAVRVSAFALELAKEARLSWADQGRAQVAGLLYNLGQIVLTSLRPELSAQMLEFCQKKRMGIELFDLVTQAINPGELGARIAEKWRFPLALIQVLRFQNQPLQAPEEQRSVAGVVHLASNLRSVELQLLEYDQIHEATLVQPRFGDVGVLKAFHQGLQTRVSHDYQ